MTYNESILLKHRDFIWAVSKDLINPNPSNNHLLEVLHAFRQIDDTIDVMAGCSTCTNIYKDTCKLIHAYCQDQNWFEVQAYNPVVTSIKVSELNKPIGKKIKIKKI
jgi:hypothetical protein